MRLKINHTTEYVYDEPVAYSLQRLRLTPLDGPGQRVIDWNISVDGATVEAGYDDQFGNRIELVSAEGQTNRMRIVARGEIETEDRTGIYGPHLGFCPLWLFLRETPLTRAGKHVRKLADNLRGDSELARLHNLMETIRETVAYQPGSTSSETEAEQALQAKSGVCQDHAHIFIAAARTLGIPARYISGYLLMDDADMQAASHAWAEAHVPGLGWIGFDAANDLCPDDRYVRIAAGLSYRDCAPVSGMRTGRSDENLNVSVSVENTGPSQSQSQSQS